ncbi:MAG: lactonase family protein [Balneolales bacterium]
MKKYLPKSLLLLLFPIAGFIGCSENASKEIIYAGTFSGNESQGLYVYEFNRDELDFELIQTLSEKVSPSFQAIHPEEPFLYSISSSPISDDNDHHTVSAYRIDQQTGKLSLINEQSVMGQGPAHVSVDKLGEFVYVSNYGSGNLSVFSIRQDGSLSEAVEAIQHEGSSVHPRQNKPHVHAIDPSPDGKFIYVSDLGLDQIKIYEINRQTGELSPAEQPWFENTPGAGPRHFTFHPTMNVAYSVEELSSTVAVLKVNPDTGALEQIQRINMLPDDFQSESTAADIHTSPDGKFLYASNRGHDSLVIYSIDSSTGELTHVGHESTLGGHPRNFWVDPEGEFVFVANRDDDNIVVFRRDQSTGLLEFTNTEVNVPRVVCVSRYML